jgi:hypothetical protein
MQLVSLQRGDRALPRAAPQPVLRPGRRRHRGRRRQPQGRAGYHFSPRYFVQSKHGSIDDSHYGPRNYLTPGSDNPVWSMSPIAHPGTSDNPVWSMSPIAHPGASDNPVWSMSPIAHPGASDNPVWSMSPIAHPGVSSDNPPTPRTRRARPWTSSWPRTCPR